MECARPPLPGLWIGAAATWTLLLLPLLVDAVATGGALRGALLAATVTAILAPWAAVASVPRLAPWVAGVACLALAAVGVVSTRELGDPWRNVWLILAITVGGMVGARLLSTTAGAWGVLAVTTGAGAAVTTAPDSDDVAWALMLTVALAGLSTIVLVHLMATIATLRATRQELADRAVLAERDRFSRDLHDLLGHSLSLVVVKAEAVRRLVVADPEAAAEHARDIEAIGRRALAEVRETVTGIRRTTLAAELSRAMTALEDAGIDADVRPAPTLLPEPVDEAFAWVVREAATNVIRHSGARRCTVQVEVEEGAPMRARLAIVDDGAAPSPELNEGNGLAGLRRRLSAVGGELLVVREPAGFGLTATAPLEGVS